MAQLAQLEQGSVPISQLEARGVEMQAYARKAAEAHGEMLASRKESEGAIPVSPRTLHQPLLPKTDHPHPHPTFENPRHTSPKL